MSAMWSWVFGIATGASLILGVIFFVATQQMTGRDVLVLSMGIVIGGMIAGLVATFVFHAPGRQTRLDRESAELQGLKDVQAAALNAEKHESDALAARKADLVAALPLRTEKLAEIRDAIAENRMELAVAEGNEQSQRFSAQEAMRVGYRDIAADNLASSKTWAIKRDQLSEQHSELEALQESLKSQTDDEYLAEQKRLRGLD